MPHCRYRILAFDPRETSLPAYNKTNVKVWGRQDYSRPNQKQDRRARRCLFRNKPLCLTR
jgi:hypothetical protein